MTALDLARTYSNYDAAQAIQHHIYLLSCEEDQTVTPQFTYKSTIYMSYFSCCYFQVSSQVKYVLFKLYRYSSI